MSSCIEKLVENDKLVVKRIDDVIEALNILNLSGYKDCKTLVNIIDAMKNIQNVMQNYLDEYDRSNEEVGGDESDGDGN